MIDQRNDQIYHTGMLLNDPRISSNAQLCLIVGKMFGGDASVTDATKSTFIAPTNFSDAIDRSRFMRTSIHIPGKQFTLQVSNMESPNQSANSTDWVDIATTTTGFIDTDLIARFFRVKAANNDTLPTGTKIHIVSIFSKY